MFFSLTEPQPNCEDCKLCEVCVHDKLPYVGEGGLGVLIIGDHPDDDQDNTGRLDTGRTYEFLKMTLSAIGIDIQKDVWYTTTIGCRTPFSRKLRQCREPSGVEIQHCKPRLDNTIKKLKPTVIIMLGETPFNSIIAPVLKGRTTGIKAKAFYGTRIPDQESLTWLCTTWSPKELFETREYEGGYTSKPFYERDRAVYKQFRTHLYEAICLYSKKIEYVNYNSLCQITEDIDIAIDWLAEIMEWKYVSFDIETNSIKCYRTGSKILSISFSNGKVSYAFPMFNDATFQRVLRRLMLNGSKKISHNTSFEYQWMRAKCGYWFSVPEIDTMLMAHCINAQKPTNLKFETYTRVGVIGYDSSADPFLKSTKEEQEMYGDNAFNTLEQCPMKDLLEYNALDSLFTYMIWEQQQKELDEFQMQGYKFLNESTIWLTKSQFNGFHIDIDRYNEVSRMLEDKIKELKESILLCDEIKLWDGEEEFNYGSTKQLGHLLFDIMEIKPTVFTPKGTPAVNIEALEKIDTPLVKTLLEIRRYEKLFNTYIHQFQLEQTDGMIHAFTYLNRVETFRSSMGSINIQNQPKRDKEAKALITSLVMPSKGHKLVGYDLKGAEVSVGACNSGDKNLVSYVEDLTKDMHRDLAMQAFMLPKNEVSSTIRRGMKGTVTFPMMYGSYYKQMAPDLYEFAEEIGMLQHFKDKGVDTYDKFEKHVEKIEKYFWGTMFPTHKKWMEKQWTDYQKYGKVSIPTGFYVYAPMRRNNTFNTPVQGSAYHCNQRTYNKVSEYIETHGMKSKVLFQIHDAIYIDMCPEEEELLDWCIWYYGTQEIKDEWTWLVTTLYYEKEAGEVDANWSTLQEIGLMGKDGKIK